MNYLACSINAAVKRDRRSTIGQCECNDPHCEGGPHVGRCDDSAAALLRRRGDLSSVRVCVKCADDRMTHGEYVVE